ncbi:MAG: cation transporter [Ruminococcaceae bacterium]|nr:cation transporter [Oscillospiraceae bacterium]
MISLLIRRFLPENADTKLTRKIYGYVCGGVGIILNLFLFATKLFIGFISSSIAITADAFNNLTDAGSSVISLFGFVLSGQKADKEHPFGHGRIEYIAGIFISVVIIYVGIELLRSSIDKILHPTEFVFNKYIVIILIVSILVKLYMAYYNRHSGKKIQSTALLAVATDSVSDAIATGAILLSAVFMYFTGIQIDGYVGLLVSLLIIKSGVAAVIQTSSPLLGGIPDRDFVKKVEEIVRENPETVGIHDLVIHDYGPNKIFVSLHMEVDGSKEIFVLHDAADLVEKQIAEELGCEAVIHMDPIDVNNPILKEIYATLQKRLSIVCPEGNVHDLRIVPGPTHTNVIFDLIVPAERYFAKDKISAELEKCVSELNENYYAVITVETSYI